MIQTFFFSRGSGCRGKMAKVETDYALIEVVRKKVNMQRVKEINGSGGTRDSLVEFQV